MCIIRQRVIPILTLAFLSIPLAPPGVLTAGSAAPHVVSPEGSGWLGISIQDLSKGIKEAAGLRRDYGVHTGGQRAPYFEMQAELVRHPKEICPIGRFAERLRSDRLNSFTAKFGAPSNNFLKNHSIGFDQIFGE